VYNKKSIDEKDVINVFGMATKEHYSEKTVEKVAKSLEKGGHSVKVIEGGMSFIDEMKDFMPKVVAGERPGMVFNMAYGIQGQNRYTHVPAMLEMLGIPYVGSGPEAHAVVQDKVMTKIVLQKNNIPTPGFWVFSSSDDEFEDLVFPVIVKPKMESTSMGMEVVDNWPDLKKAVAKQIEKFSQEILVEH
jgi:D-alanine-D-alanine ligase